ncbi:hypothetical protein E3P84_03543 [Wallemia ichthyophaga]|nr:hypothetical protein E3P84_03543 [Wallemia ichthyophaga]TIB39459.1 hypothetical protein E3P83_03469 [Wallemia ichthyophaga]
MLSERSVAYNNKHSFVTGGSQGLGLALASELVNRGSSVTICARNESKLAAAVAQIEKHRSNDNQFIHYVSADLTKYTQALHAIERATELALATQKMPPSLFFACAGCSTPGWFAEMSIEEFEWDMQANYFSALHTAKAATQNVLQHTTPHAHITLVSSVLGFPLGVPGYSAYTPSKHAVRGLGDALRTELLLHDITTHVYFPGTIYSPGYEKENQTKPALTKKIEGAADGLTPEQCARALLKGIDKGEYQITSDFVGSLIKNLSRGASPSNNLLIDTLLFFVAAIAFPFWRIYMDYLVKKERKTKTAK